MQEMTGHLWAPGKKMLAPLGLPPDLILCVKFVLQHQAMDHEATSASSAQAQMKRAYLVMH